MSYRERPSCLSGAAAVVRKERSRWGRFLGCSEGGWAEAGQESATAALKGALAATGEDTISSAAIGAANRADSETTDNNAETIDCVLSPS